MRTRNVFSERFDWTLCLLLMLFCLVSSIAIYSANAVYLQSQIMWYVIGAVVIAIIMYFDNEQIQQITWILYGIGRFINRSSSCSRNGIYSTQRRSAKLVCHSPYWQYSTV